MLPIGGYMPTAMIHDTGAAMFGAKDRLYALLENPPADPIVAFQAGKKVELDLAQANTMSKIGYAMQEAARERARKRGAQLPYNLYPDWKA